MVCREPFVRLVEGQVGLAEGGLGQGERRVRGRSRGQQPQVRGRVATFRVFRLQKGAHGHERIGEQLSHREVGRPFNVTGRNLQVFAQLPREEVHQVEGMRSLLGSLLQEGSGLGIVQPGHQPDRIRGSLDRTRDHVLQETIPGDLPLPRKREVCGREGALALQLLREAGDGTKPIVLFEVDRHRPGHPELEPVQVRVFRLVDPGEDAHPAREFPLGNIALDGLAFLVQDGHRRGGSAQVLASEQEEHQARGQEQIECDPHGFHPGPAIAAGSPVGPGEERHGGNHEQPGRDDDVGDVGRENPSPYGPVGEFEEDPAAREVRPHDVWDAPPHELGPKGSSFAQETPSSCSERPRHLTRQTPGVGRHAATRAS